MIDCYIPLGTVAAKWASADLSYVTPANGGTATDSTGFDFNDDDTVSEEVWCQWVVPQGYDSTATEVPTVRLIGWSKTCVICIPGLTCDTTRKVEWEVQSRAYNPNDRANEAWSTASVGTWDVTSESCGSPCSTNCYQSERLYSVSVNAAADAGDMGGGDLVYIRILRDKDATNDLPSNVHVSTVSIDYPVE